ncbi:MAG: VOC family protein [Endozoicomonas sp.]|uniref:VOC family protein n=1 Tax=Endozoicomonas sp. TaxID=1892382 RepID=UPI003D9B6B84
MEITLNHTIVPCSDKVFSARFYERIFGFQFLKVWGHFALVRVNSSLTLDFDESTGFSHNHYAFKVSHEQFSAIFERVKQEGMDYGSGPGHLDDGQVNHRNNGSGVYFRDPDGHVLEILTRDYKID